MAEENASAAAPEPAWWRRQLRENPGLILTAAYLLLTVVGAVYNWRLCRRFGINILDLADGTDFLMFAVRDFAVVAWAAFAIGLFAGMYALIAHLKAAPPKQRNVLMRVFERQVKRSSLRVQAVVCTLWAAFFVFYYLDQYARNVAGAIKSGAGHACEYVLAGDPQGVPRAAQLVTTTSRFVVVFSPQEKVTEVIPTESISRLVFR